jgi:hypothetical protein
MPNRLASSQVIQSSDAPLESSDFDEAKKIGNKIGKTSQALKIS